MNPVALTPYDTARQIMSTNFLGTFAFTHAAMRLLRSSRTGRIVNFTTVAVPMRLEGEAIYAASKSAVETFTRIVAREAAPFGITCNAVGPSPVRTQLTENVGTDKIEKLLARQAIPHWAESSDVANVVDFFLRPESAMITGQVIYLGGAG
jgi:3-oxoacyl-[acyl-carrier protein] reductase